MTHENDQHDLEHIQNMLDKEWDDYWAFRGVVARRLAEAALDITFDQHGNPVDGWYRSLNLYKEFEDGMILLNRNIRDDE